jgi:FlaA1/EpsC-like NDP-sugar epimerase
MGNPVKIMDLAKRMIQLAGLKLSDIPIVHTGLRPGEKMYEELFKDSEEFAETYHPRILRAKKSPSVISNFNSLMIELEQAALSHSNEIIPFILRKMVPEFNTSEKKLNIASAEQVTVLEEIKEI